MMPAEFNELSPAKLNLFLRILGQKNNGYHIIRTGITFLDLYDEMIIEFYPSGVFEIFDKKNKKIYKKIDFEKVSLALEDMSFFNK